MSQSGTIPLIRPYRAPRRRLRSAMARFDRMTMRTMNPPAVLLDPPAHREG